VSVDERCSPGCPAVLDFLRSTYVGRAAPPVEECWDSEDEEEEVVEAGEAEAGRWSVRSSDPRAPGVFFLYFPWCLTYLLPCCGACFCLVVGAGLCLFPLFCVFALRFLLFCVFLRSGGRGDEVLPLSPPFGAGRRIKWCAAIVY